MSNLTAADTVWRAVREELQRQGSLGTALRLCCEIHGTKTAVSSAEDIDQQCPQGGCLRLCGVMLACSHPCQQVCHTANREHKNFRWA